MGKDAQAAACISLYAQKCIFYTKLRDFLKNNFRQYTIARLNKQCHPTTESIGQRNLYVADTVTHSEKKTPPERDAQGRQLKETFLYPTAATRRTRAIYERTAVMRSPAKKERCLERDLVAHAQLQGTRSGDRPRTTEPHILIKV